jgi:hypothetical protein
VLSIFGAIAFWLFYANSKSIELFRIKKYFDITPLFRNNHVISKCPLFWYDPVISKEWNCIEIRDFFRNSSYFEIRSSSKFDEFKSLRCREEN